MVRYFLNWMGPINTEWIAKHGEDWCAGRIDICGVIEDEYPYGIEYGVPTMKWVSWVVFGDWLSRLRTDIVLEKDELFARFEQETGRKIEWLEKNDA